MHIFDKLGLSRFCPFKCRPVGLVLSILLGLALATVGGLFLGSHIGRVTGAEQTTCQRQLDGFEATLALGDVIREARAISGDSPATRRARADFLRIRRPAVATNGTRAIMDLQVLVAGAGVKPADPTRLLAAEDRYISAARKLMAPRACGIGGTP